MAWLQPGAWGHAQRPGKQSQGRCCGSEAQLSAFQGRTSPVYLRSPQSPRPLRNRRKRWWRRAKQPGAPDLRAEPRCSKDGCGGKMRWSSVGFRGYSMLLDQNRRSRSVGDVQVCHWWNHSGSTFHSWLSGASILPDSEADSIYIYTYIHIYIYIYTHIYIYIYKCIMSYSFFFPHMGYTGETPITLFSLAVWTSMKHGDFGVLQTLNVWFIDGYPTILDGYFPMGICSPNYCSSSRSSIPCLPGQTTTCSGPWAWGNVMIPPEIIVDLEGWDSQELSWLLQPIFLGGYRKLPEGIYPINIPLISH